jgi:hypothetical protein
MAGKYCSWWGNIYTDMQTHKYVFVCVYPKEIESKICEVVVASSLKTTLNVFSFYIFRRNSHIKYKIKIYK